MTYSYDEIVQILDNARQKMKRDTFDKMIGWAIVKSEFQEVEIRKLANAIQDDINKIKE